MPCRPRHTPNTGMPALAANFTRSGTPKSAGRSGPGEIRIRSGAIFAISSEGNARAIGHHFGAGLARVVRQRVDEAIVVVDQQQLHAVAGAC